MKNIEMMKTYIRERGLTGQVRELVESLGMSTAAAIEDVYDSHTLTRAEYAAKYLA